ncbi:MAG: hypothetical protein ABL970_04330 [Nitrospira sp.]
MERPGLNGERGSGQVRMRLRVGWVVLVMMLTCLNWLPHSRAAEWSAEPSLSLKGEYNSNLLLFNGNNQVWGQWTTPGVKFKGATESLELEGGARADFVRYYGERDRELTNLYFPLKASYRSDRLTFGFDGGFTRDNTLLAELRQTGLVLGFTQRNLWTAAPSLTVGLTERLSWQTAYQFMDAQYQDGIRFGLVNYQVHGGTTGMTYNSGERDQVQVTGEYAYVTMPAILQHSTYYGAQTGWTHDFGHDVTGSLSGGARFISSTQNFSGGSVTDYQMVGLYHATVRKKWERTMVQLDASREVNPSGFGLLLQTDRYGATVSHGFTETLTVALNGGLYSVSGVATVGLSQTIPRTRFTSVSPSLSWKFAQWWVLDVAYTYSERGVGSLEQWNFSNATFVMLTYGGAKWSVSR